MVCFRLEVTIEQATNVCSNVNSITSNAQNIVMETMYLYKLYMFCNISVNLSRDMIADFCKH